MRRELSKAAIRRALTTARSLNTAALELETTPQRIRKYILETNDVDLKRRFAECKERGYEFSGGRGAWARERG